MYKIEKLINKISKKIKPINVMEHKGFKASLQRAKRLKDNGSLHSLPPGKEIDVFYVDSFPGSPKGWIGGPGSFICPVDPDWGLWFDWTMNDKLNTSVIASVKGMNPVTGDKIENLSMESYEEKCPRHNIAFKGKRYCNKCEYKWPPQNYVCSPNTLWWDGFRQPDGSVRQFFFSEDEKRDIASLVIGKHNTVPAFGFAFYEPKKRREQNNVNINWKNNFPSHLSNCTNVVFTNSATVDQKHIPLTRNTICRSLMNNQNTCDTSELSNIEDRSEIKNNNFTVDVSVGAGAEIEQDLQKDNIKVDDWKTDPSSIIRLYFVFADELKSYIKNGGIKNLEGNNSGYLKGLPTG